MVTVPAVGRSRPTVVAAAGDGVAATRIARQHQPDVILMDIRMAGGDGITATRAITTDPACQHTRIIAVTTFDLDEYVFGALRAGASGLPAEVHPPR